MRRDNLLLLQLFAIVFKLVSSVHDNLELPLDINGVCAWQASAGTGVARQGQLSRHPILINKGKILHISIIDRILLASHHRPVLILNIAIIHFVIIVPLLHSAGRWRLLAKEVLLANFRVFQREL